MGLFDKLKKKDELPEKDRKWNKMWDLWAEGEAAAPYAQLMTYDSEVNNGGHSQYFFQCCQHWRFEGGGGGHSAHPSRCAAGQPEARL